MALASIVPSCVRPKPIDLVYVLLLFERATDEPTAYGEAPGRVQRRSASVSMPRGALIPRSSSSPGSSLTKDSSKSGCARRAVPTWTGLVPTTRNESTSSIVEVPRAVRLGGSVSGFGGLDANKLQGQLPCDQSGDLTVVVVGGHLHYVHPDQGHVGQTSEDF